MQIEQTRNHRAPDLFRRFFGGIAGRLKTMKDAVMREERSGQSAEWRAGFLAYGNFNPSNPYPPGSVSHREWEMGFDEADRCSGW